MLNTKGLQTLTLTGLRFDANLGILAHEKTAPQPIQVDAELNLGPQPLLPRDDDAAGWPWIDRREDDCCAGNDGLKFERTIL